MLIQSLNFSPEQGMISTDVFLEKIIGLVNSTDIPIASKRSRGETLYYYNIPAAFDIEVSSFYQNGEKKACMYIWQFGILNWVTYGRTWEELYYFTRALCAILRCRDGPRLVVYVHNLSYEFQFIRQRFEWDKIFFLDERKPVYAVTKEGIEFRCSWKLSSKSLAKVGNDLQKYTAHKSTGDLDYTLIRTSETELSQTELGYCENDIRVILAYIQEKIETDGDISKIPLTNTGYVRQYCRTECFKKRKIYKAVINSLTLEPSEYKVLKEGYTGGFTHANASYVEAGRRGVILKNVQSYDFTSSYPAVMVLEKFPMSKGVELTKFTMEDFHRYLKTHCCLIEVTFNGLKPKLDFEHPLSVSKCRNKADVIEDNGRVVEASTVTTTITEQDWFTLTEFYSVESFSIHKLIVYKKSYLPKSFIRSILELYKRKTVLKDVEGEEVNYMISKNMLNSAYGMSVTDIVRDEVQFDNESVEPFQSTKPNLVTAIENYNIGSNRFLFYPWGVWVCAYARRNLFTGIKECGDDYIYADTDSVKLLHPEKHQEYFKTYNENILNKIKLVSEYYGFSQQDFSPKTKEGVVKTIGVWDDDGRYDEFKTLGAKRYLVRKKDKYILTVAGLNKRNAMDWMVQEAKRKKCSPFDLFTDELCVPATHSGRLVHTYVDEPCDGVIVDYTGKKGEYHEKTYIHMEASEYDLTMSDMFEAFLDKILERDEEVFS